ncbi:MAG: calcium/proton exchanger [Chloroflexi bacterium]|nr:calcium/proton exchanger [Chloroflexota bacterium]
MSQLLSIHGLLIFLPIALLGKYVLKLDDVPIFVLAALAIIPLAKLIGEATEELAHYLGETWGGLLNATLGNAAELIITIFALQAGKVELVRASIVGSILGNLLLVMGFSMLVGGLKNGVQKFNRNEASMNATMVVLAFMAMAVPSFFDRAVIGKDPLIVDIAPSAADAHGRELFFTEGIALVLIVLYALSILYTFTSKKLAPVSHEAVAEHQAQWSKQKALIILGLATLGIVLMSETLVGAVEGATHQLGLSEFFVGIIIVPLIGNVAEHLVAVQVAFKNKMDLSLAISFGSGLQIALFVAPVLVFASLLFDDQLLLVFNPYELISLAVASFIAASVAQDGESNWLEGVQLLALYVIIGLAFFVLPN